MTDIARWLQHANQDTGRRFAAYLIARNVSLGCGWIPVLRWVETASGIKATLRPTRQNQLDSA